MTDPERPHCFADLEQVFPMGPEGLRSTPERCMVCYCKTECLRAAMSREEGVRVREEALDRAYAAGVLGFFERWSKKKAFQQERKARAKAGR